MNRREFLKASGLGALALAVAPRQGRTSESAPAFAKGAVELPPVIADYEVVSNPKFKGRKCASYFCDDTVWVLRDLARQRPKSMFDNPFLRMLREAHDRYGLKLQCNLFYRTDFFYGMDEFTLADMPDAYRKEWEASSDWLQLGFHSLQEFPDYPFVNAKYADVKKLLGMIRGEVTRFAGEDTFAKALVTHWCPMSREGCLAVRDSGIKLLHCTVGKRYRYDGDASRLPYGHSARLEQNRQPETALFLRDCEDEAIKASLCAYNNLSEEQDRETRRSFRYLIDKSTGLRLKHLTLDGPVLNLMDEKTLRANIEKMLGGDYLIFSNHEQYFYRDYLAYQPDYSAKVMAMAEMMQKNGYEFIRMQDVVG